MIWLGPSLFEGIKFCPPDGVTVGQSARVAIRYLEAHPARQHEPFGDLAMQAFQEAWPCRNSVPRAKDGDWLFTGLGGQAIEPLRLRAKSESPGTPMSGLTLCGRKNVALWLDLKTVAAGLISVQG